MMDIGKKSVKILLLKACKSANMTEYFIWNKIIEVSKNAEFYAHFKFIVEGFKKFSEKKLKAKKFKKGEKTEKLLI